MKLARKVANIALVIGLISSSAQAQEVQPLSVIDWLSDSVDLPELPAREPETPIANTASTPQITVTALDDPSPDGVGILPSELTGLPRELWAGSATADLAPAIAALPRFDIPALRDFVTMLMLAEVAPPIDSGPDGVLFLARVDQLLTAGRLDEALALLEAAKPDTPALFRRYFDIALLTGQEDTGCDIMQNRPAVAPTVPALIFCLARSGDWNAAALTLNTNRLLGDVPEDDVELLTLFLDPELAESVTDIPRPDRMTPLTFRLLEAIGERPATAGLPLAFAHADLRETTGWKSQLDAAERLARHGSLPATRLQELYGSRTPSASGGVWDRMDAYQRLDLAMNANDASAIARALPPAWDAMKAIRSEHLLATLYGADLARVAMPEAAEALTGKLLLLSESYEVAATKTGIDPFLKALAMGRPQEVQTADPQMIAIQAAFNGAPAPDDLVELAGNGQLGMSILKSLTLLDQGIRGNHAALTSGLAFLRRIGLEDLARRTSLQILILERQR